MGETQTVSFECDWVGGSFASKLNYFWILRCFLIATSVEKRVLNAASLKDYID